MKYILLIAFLLLFAFNVSAAETKLEIELFPSGLASETIVFDLTAGQDSNQLVYSLQNNPENLKVYEGNTELNYKIEKNELYDIVIQKQVSKGERHKIILKFDIKGLVEQTGDKYIFSLKYELDSSFENLGVVAKLPDGFVLADIESAVSPGNYKIETDGREIIIKWDDINPIGEQSFIIVYERGISRSISYLWIIMLVILALLIAGFFILRIRHKKEKKEIVSGVLSQDEKKIVDMIEKGNEVAQKDVVKETGFSKAKVSKIVRRLEEMGIVEKKPWMATNKLRLKNK